MKPQRLMTALLVAGGLLATAGCATTSGGSVPADAQFVEPLTVGESLPPITLLDQAGQAFDLNAAVAQGPSILVFYRGGWCPYCRSHLAQLNNIELQLDSMGYQVFAISADKPSKLMETAELEAPTFTLLSDSGMDAARALGIAFRVDDETFRRYNEDYGIDLEASSGRTHHQLPVPSVFIVGPDGVIRYEYVNPDYKVRLAPDDLIAAAFAARGD